MSKPTYLYASDLIFPDVVKDGEFKEFMKSLLTKSSSTRLSSVSLIKQSSYFQDFSFDELLNLNLKAPYIPKIQDPQNLKSIPLKKHLDSYLRDYEIDEKVSPTSNSTQDEYNRWFFNF